MMRPKGRTHAAASSRFPVYAAREPVAAVRDSCLADDAGLGREIYQDHWKRCHGKGMASGGLAFDLRKFPLNDPQRFEKSVVNGTEKRMPAWRGQLSAEDVKGL